MKALSLWEPWAYLVACGAKTFETRSRPLSHRGLLAIHAAKHWNRETQRLVEQPPFNLFWEARSRLGHTHKGGCIIAVVNMVDCTSAEDVQDSLRHLTCSHSSRIAKDAEHELKFGSYTPGRFAYHLLSPVCLSSPIYTRGYQGLWNLPEDVAETVAASLLRAAQEPA